MQPVKSLKCQLSYVRRIHLSLHWQLEIKSSLEFLVLRNVPLYLRRNKSSQSFFDREWSTYGSLDSHNPLYCATGLILLLWHQKELQTYNSCTFMAKKAI